MIILFAFNIGAEGLKPYSPPLAVFEAQSNGFVFRMKLSDKECVLSEDGTITSFRNGKVVAKSKLGADGSIEGAYFFEVGSDLILVAQENFGGEGMDCFITRINQDTLTRKWFLKIPTFNLAEPLVHGRFIYLAGLGFLGKLDWEKGKFLWMHENLYSQGKVKIEQYDAPRLFKGTVIFHEKADDGRSGRSVKVKESSGEILSVK